MWRAHTIPYHTIPHTTPDQTRQRNSTHTTPHHLLPTTNFLILYVLLHVLLPSDTLNFNLCNTHHFVTNQLYNRHSTLQLD
ncbi:hypothetical protein VTL71DRAFT_14688 [Oculimacula yallundae]|uniref:Uncharacterized protein n=1 Tax=Oculimacula yallundae TaxID=86028 RepID=A0ABR4CJ72_9HELO